MKFADEKYSSGRVLGTEEALIFSTVVFKAWDNFGT